MRFCLPFFVLLLLLACIAGAAPVIQGVIFDPDLGAIEAARVSCSGRVAFSNAEGRFVLPLETDCDAVIEKSGFEKASSRLRAGAGNRVVLTLRGPLQSVQVTATHSQATPEEAAVSANVISARELAARDYPPVFDVLRELPGIDIVQAGRPGSVASVFTRGGASTSTLILLDGVPLNDPGGQINLAHIGSIGLDRIEAVRGPESAAFGAEAASGAIQLFTRRGDPERTIPHGSVSYERGSFGTDRWIANLDGGLAGKFDYALASSQLHSIGEYANDFYRNHTGSANIGYRLTPSTLLRGVFRVYDAHFGTPGQIAFGVSDLQGNEETRDDTVSARLEDTRGARYFQTFAFGYHRLHDQSYDDVFGQQDITAIVRDVPRSHIDTYLVALLDSSVPPPAAGQLAPGTRVAAATAFYGFGDFLNETERRTADYQGTLAENKGALVFGYEYQKQMGELVDFRASRDHHGLFVNEQYAWGERTSFSVGARVEHSSAFGTEFAPRGGLSYRIAGAHGALTSVRARVSAGRGIVEPSLEENFARSQYEIGNPALKPEVTNSLEAALGSEWFGGRFSLEATSFRNSFENLIQYTYPTFANVARSWARGLELSTQARLPLQFTVTGNYTRLYSRVVDTGSPTDAVTGIGRELLRRPRNSGSLILSAAPRRWTFLFGARIAGERQDSDFLGLGLTRNPGYEDLYFSTSYRFARHFEPVLRINNLLDERYQEALGYLASSRSAIGGLRILW